eukprot:TRINITY_DN10322_c0_g1_i1.p6 TRINITY_DN10322_c0_g1~~TRINITY_DN10322_c0_g1_i1.p6  ORF type:complete len:107 (+),score=12.28 TRINITY_DN10322_c0_g1_i1:1469-1789(+)
MHCMPHLTLVSSWPSIKNGRALCFFVLTYYRNHLISRRLSAQETFKIVNLEAWLVGLPDENGPAAQRSILDGRETDTAILEMAGRKMHSQGLREPHPEDDESDDDK